MRVLLIGSGGREHALAQAITRSPLLSALYVAPGNPGISAIAQCVPIKADDIEGLVSFAKKEKIDLVVPGPEVSLVAGIADECEKAGIACAGPSKAAAQLEGSKSFTKEIADAASIPTARWKRFETSKEEALAYIREHGAPIVLKTDGLAAGKGVIVAQTMQEAEDALNTLELPLVVEDCLFGKEVSLFAFCSGTEAVLIGAARDHKRAFDGDKGPNTGGMGAVCPPPDFDSAAQEKALDLTVRPMLAEMVKRGTPFKGVIFAGLMLTEEGPKLIEYNVRFGDPEAQALLIRLESDLLPALEDLAHERLSSESVTFSDQPSLSLVLAARGYPDKPITGGVITGIETAEAQAGVSVFHAGTKLEDGQLVAAGGRVLTICAKANTPEKARSRAYEAAAAIQWDDKMLRSDIGA